MSAKVREVLEESAIITAHPLHVCDRGDCPARATTPVKVQIIDPVSGLVTWGELVMCAHHANETHEAMATRLESLNA